MNRVLFRSPHSAVLALWVIGIAAAPLAGQANPARGKPALVRAYGSRGLSWKAGERYYSPDGKYAVVLSVNLATTNLHVVARGSNRPIVMAGCADGFQWLPGHRHRLVVATSFVYGRGNLLSWSGGRTWKHLITRRNAKTDDFSLLGYRPASREIVYVHGRFGPDGRQLFERTRSLRCP